MLWWRENWSRCRAIGIEDILELYGISSSKSGLHEEQDIVNLIEIWLTNAYPNIDDTERVGTPYYTSNDSELLTEIMLAAAEREQTVIVKFILAQSAKFHPSKSLETDLCWNSWDFEGKKEAPNWYNSNENPKVIEVLLQGGLRPSKSLLLQATKEGNLPVLKKLVENGGYIEHTYGILSKKLIHIAAEENQPEVVEYLIACDSDINSLLGGHTTPLNRAIRSGSKSIVDLLLKAGADPNISETPAVHEAVFNPNASMLAHLCDHHGLDIEQPENEGGGRQLIHSAVSYSSRSTECLRFLIDRGVNVNAQDNDGQTPLDIACMHKRADCVEMLLEAGAAIDMATNYGETPFQMVAQFLYSHPDIIADTYALLATHIAKKLTAGLYVGARNHQRFQSDLRCLNDNPLRRKVFEEIEAAKGGWEEEIELMKRCKIHGSLSVYNLLASRNALAYSKDPSFIRALETFDYDQFPHYKSLLKLKIDEERKKTELRSKL